MGQGDEWEQAPAESSEDPELQRALAASMGGADNDMGGMSEDEMLARALQESAEAAE